MGSEPKQRAAERLTALDARLKQLRAQLSEVSASSLESEIEALEDEKKLAHLVYNALRGDPRRIRRFVRELAHLDASASKGRE